MSLISEIGFVTKSFSTVLTETIDSLRSCVERLNLTPGQLAYQFVKFSALREYEIIQTEEAIATSTSIVSAIGDLLDRWGIECGIKRKGATSATSEITVTGVPSNTTIPAGSKFTNSNGISYSTTSSATLPIIIEMEKDTDLTDSIPYPYSGVTTITWCNTQIDQSGTTYTEGIDFYYEDDVVYWYEGYGPASGTTYYLSIEGSVSVSTPITCDYAGTGGNTASGSITINTSSIPNVTSVTNLIEVTNGSDSETDAKYRVRMLQAKRRNFTLARVESIANEVEGVRNAIARQDTAIDQTAHSDWIGASSDSYLTGYAPSGQLYDTVYIQTFVPAAVSLRGVTLRGRKIGTPVPLKVDLLLWSDGKKYSYEGTGMASFATKYFLAEDVDPSDPTANQDIYVPIRFGGFDSTRTYAVTVQQSGATWDNHWQLAYCTGYNPGAVSEWRKSLSIYHAGATTSYPLDLTFKTHYGCASYTIQTAIDQNADWDTVEEAIDSLLDYEDGDGFSPIGIQYNISRATEVYIYVKANIFTDIGEDFTTIASSIESDINTYINSLKTGDNVIYSKIMGIIMNVTGVSKCDTLYIKRSSSSWAQTDVTILSSEIANLLPSTSGGVVLSYAGQVGE